MTILELKTGLFPDASRVDEAVKTLQGSHPLEEADATRLADDDEAGWRALARAILAADLVVTL